MIVAQTVQNLVVLASEEEHEINQVLSWGIGLLVLGIMLALFLALTAFGNGREHS
ncbi:hypothetical protein I601_3866 [Nocardioides dokdonensis FR1436]|uniref:Uncharacterized protein n=1 Tax=Nocardioides dokdonensis FR1436 TaxID=1300347 RepID=A0A1A9GPN2_9ACTN|nr:hypothetical protein [Nocardioides dokdonensis]ANH40264.1 hypothetical protein I601_3866 [Nocardioides dokdonensis FR1436]